VIATTPGPLTMREALYYSLSHPVSTVIIGCDSLAQLEKNVQLAREFTPLSERQMASLAARAEPFPSRRCSSGSSGGHRAAPPPVVGQPILAASRFSAGLDALKARPGRALLACADKVSARQAARLRHEAAGTR